MDMMAQANSLATRVLDDMGKPSLQELEDRIRPDLIKRFDESLYLKNRDQVVAGRHR